MHQTLIESAVNRADAFKNWTGAVRNRLAALLQLPEAGPQIVFTPSGTDAELQALFVAHTLLGGPLTSIVMAADETGSGTPLAITGRHFSDSTAGGYAVAKGQPIDGMDTTIERIDIPIGKAGGQVRCTDEVDRVVCDAVEGAIRNGRKVLIHAMDCSKFGRRAPSWDCLDALTARWPHAVQVVVDACQMRLSRQRLHHDLGRRAMVLITGSKFFTGPPFSGALLIPETLSAQLCDALDVPSGLGMYTGRSDWPAIWPSLHAELPDRHNVGQWLRWEAALAEMEAYFAVPQRFRTDALTYFGQTTADVIVDGGLQLLDQGICPSGNMIADGEFATRTIFPFILRQKGRCLSYAEVVGVYRALNQDVASMLPPNASQEDIALAALPCHIGQPVLVRTENDGNTAALRISAGARIVSEHWRGNYETSHHSLHDECDQVRQVVKKIGLLLAHQITAPTYNGMCSLRKPHPEGLGVPSEN